VSFPSRLSTPRDQIDNGAAKGQHYLLEVDNPLVLPVGKKVRFITTSNDVIHSWWVPAFGVKRDAVPGFLREFWATVEKTGTYRGQCSELCGKEHGFMPVVGAEKSRPQTCSASSISSRACRRGDRGQGRAVSAAPTDI
jgi:cytochrome c oxidase subunit II